jgi:hypothetical protein
MTLEIPESITLSDGTSAIVRGINAKVIDGKLNQIVYTVEKASGAWTDIPAEELPTSVAVA